MWDEDQVLKVKCNVIFAQQYHTFLQQFPAEQSGDVAVVWPGVDTVDTVPRSAPNIDQFTTSTQHVNTSSTHELRQDAEVLLEQPAAGFLQQW